MPPRKKATKNTKAEIDKKRGHEDVDKDSPDDVKGTSPPSKTAKTLSSSSKIIDYLLSDEALELANPPPETGHGEIDWTINTGHDRTPPPDDAGKAVNKEKAEILRYPHSHLTPLQNLICALLLSKPLSHRLGLRTIHTLLNPPFSIRNLSDLDEAGYDGRRKIMWEARTQHKEKTASQLGDVVEGLREICGTDHDADISDLKQVHEMIKGKKTAEAQDEVKRILTRIKGIGPGGVGIFLRRVQVDWQEVYPYVDEKSLAVARDFGLVEEGEGAEQLSGKVKTSREFGRLLDTLVGLGLERKVDEARRAADAR